MSQAKYFIITSGGYGISISKPLSRDEVLLNLEPDHYRHVKVANRTVLARISRANLSVSTVLEYVPSCDHNCMLVPPHNGILTLIIKGDIVVPRPVDVVKQYELP